MCNLKQRMKSSDILICLQNILRSILNSDVMSYVYNLS